YMSVSASTTRYTLTLHDALPIWENRAGIFLKAADLLAGPYRAKINAATMIGQSKNAFQAEIDSACELIDFLRFNVEFMTQIYAEDRKSTRLNSSHVKNSYAVFCF